jgi:hypothetical protein
VGGAGARRRPLRVRHGRRVQQPRAAQPGDRRSARAARLHVAHYLLLGGPGETADTLAETLDRCEALDDAVLFFFCGVRIYPSTEVHAIALAEGQIEPGADLLAPRFYAPRGLELDAVRDAVAARARARGRRNWIVGSGDDRMAALARRLYRRGYVGPLWDRLVSGEPTGRRA